MAWFAACEIEKLGHGSCFYFCCIGVSHQTHQFVDLGCNGEHWAFLFEFLIAEIVAQNNVSCRYFKSGAGTLNFWRARRNIWHCKHFHAYLVSAKFVNAKLFAYLFSGSHGIYSKMDCCGASQMLNQPSLLCHSSCILSFTHIYITWLSCEGLLPSVLVRHATEWCMESGSFQLCGFWNSMPWGKTIQWIFPLGDWQSCVHFERGSSHHVPIDWSLVYNDRIKFCFAYAASVTVHRIMGNTLSIGTLLKACGPLPQYLFLSH